ncbi:hypothetical protein TNCV_3709861 [Trichonephila clavipes]|nr:hypothetical protein TNCV_3709861 [Trichonephila clavipes]
MQDAFYLLALTVVLHFPPTSYLRTPLAIFFFVEAITSALVSSLPTFFRHPRFPQVDFNVVIGLRSSKKKAADYENSVMTIHDPCDAVI